MYTRITILYLIFRSCSAQCIPEFVYLWFSFGIKNEDGRGHDIKRGNTLFYIWRNKKNTHIVLKLLRRCINIIMLLFLCTDKTAD